MRPVTRRSSRSQRGHSMMEAALIFLPFFAMIFAIIDYSMIFFLQGTFKHAAREGVRYAITQRTQTGFGQIDSIKSVVRRHAMGFLTPEQATNMVDIKFYQLDQSPDRKGYIEVTGPGRNANGNIIEITISPCAAQNGNDCYRWGWMAPLQASPDAPGRGTHPYVIRARALDVMGAPPDDTLPAL